jgi:hypothetical protein
LNLNIKVYDKVRHEYLIWQKIKSKNSATYSFANEDNSYRIGWSALEYPKRYVLCFSLGQKDKNGVVLFSSDYVMNAENELGLIQWDAKNARFIVKYGGKFRLVETSKIEKVGDIFHATNKVKELLNG